MDEADIRKMIDKLSGSGNLARDRLAARIEGGGR
jgi:hypothetical protein